VFFSGSLSGTDVDGGSTEGWLAVISSMMGLGGFWFGLGRI